MSKEDKRRDLAPPEREEEKPKLRDYKVEEDEVVAEEKIEYRVEPKESKASD